ncbi:hypothetical protein Nepgr_015787 [Nepenthes gracilis]|uniref:Uncharacterized protein n=1 Tax=Nepenthes gracilis TaxID=150966 RepID=A0AAD3SP87_NEPGR|nr:hypothetical protein Nepgr_015787 [Nepenthes gracilis]
MSLECSLHVVGCGMEFSSVFVGRLFEFGTNIHFWCDHRDVFVDGSCGPALMIIFLVKIIVELSSSKCCCASLGVFSVSLELFRTGLNPDLSDTAGILKLLSIMLSSAQAQVLIRLVPTVFS